MGAYLVVALLPYSDAFVVTSGDNYFADLADGEGPYFAKVAVHLHDVLELVAVPVLDEFVFAGGEEIVRVALEGDLHDRVLMGEETLVTVSKVKTPDLDILVG